MKIDEGNTAKQEGVLGLILSNRGPPRGNWRAEQHPVRDSSRQINCGSSHHGYEGGRQGGNWPAVQERIVCVGLFGRGQRIQLHVVTENRSVRGSEEIPAYLVRVLVSYLSDRTLLYGDSGCQKVTNGVPQGSVLGPLLWNVMYDDLLRMDMPGNVRGSRVSLIAFADDMAQHGPEN